MDNGPVKTTDDFTARDLVALIVLHGLFTGQQRIPVTVSDEIKESVTSSMVLHAFTIADKFVQCMK